MKALTKFKTAILYPLEALSKLRTKAECNLLFLFCFYLLTHFCCWSFAFQYNAAQLLLLLFSLIIVFNVLLVLLFCFVRSWFPAFSLLSDLLLLSLTFPLNSSGSVIVYNHLQWKSDARAHYPVHVHALCSFILCASPQQGIVTNISCAQTRHSDGLPTGQLVCPKYKTWIS